MSAILNFAVNNDYVPSNPMHKSVSKGKKNAEGIQFWTLDELKQFYESVKDKPMSEVIFNFMF